MKEHRAAIGRPGRSAAADHAADGHDVQFDSAKILLAESNSKRRKILEALVMSDNRTFTSNTPSFGLRVFV